MQLKNEDTTLSISGVSGQAFGVNFNATLFSTLTANLYKDKPRAVTRETIANAVDANRERDYLFGDATPSNIKANPLDEALKARYDSLVEQGFADPRTPYEVHVPTEIEPWYSITDYGIGLVVDKILGPEQFVDGVAIVDEAGHPVRSGGIYTTLFGSDKTTNDRAIGAYGLGAKSPFSISDSFMVSSVVNGYENKYIMFLDSDKTPKVDWLTKDPITGKEAAIKTERKNGIRVRIDSIQSNIFSKIQISVAEILQTFPLHEQPIVNGGLFVYNPIVKRELMRGVSIVDRSSTYGSVFRNDFVINTGGVVYPISREFQEELMSDSRNKFMNFTKQNPIMIDMELGTVNIPPSREEISYDEYSLNNIREKFLALDVHVDSKIKEITDTLVLTPVGVAEVYGELCEVIGDVEADLFINGKLDDLKPTIKKGLHISFMKGELKYMVFVDPKSFNDEWRTYRRSSNVFDSYHGRLSANALKDVVNNRGYLETTCYFGNKQGAMIILNDVPCSRSSVITKINTMAKGSKGNSYSTIKEVLIFGEDHRVSDRFSDGYLERIESKVQPICDINETEYVLASDIFKDFEIFKSNLKKMAKVSSTEITRNISRIDLSSGFYETNNGIEDLFSYGDGEQKYWMSEEDKHILKNDANIRFVESTLKYSSKTGLYLSLSEKFSSLIYVVKGIRTESALAVRSDPERFIRLVPSEILDIIKESTLRSAMSQLTTNQELWGDLFYDRATRAEGIQSLERLGIPTLMSLIFLRTKFPCFKSMNSIIKTFRNMERKIIENSNPHMIQEKFLAAHGVNYKEAISLLEDYLTISSRAFHSPKTDGEAKLLAMLLGSGHKMYASDLRILEAIHSVVNILDWEFRDLDRVTERDVEHAHTDFSKEIKSVTNSTVKALKKSDVIVESKTIEEVIRKQFLLAYKFSYTLTGIGSEKFNRDIAKISKRNLI